MAVDSSVDGIIPNVPTMSNALESVHSLNGENIPIINSHDLTYICLFGQIYLIGKLLGESMPLKAISSKCLSD